MIDIIIPCYNSHPTIDRCIGSIISQTLVKECKVTLVRDGGETYEDVIDRYSSVLDIKEIGYDENRGPACARNYGLQNTSEELVLFMDSDDALANPFSIAMLSNEINADPNTVVLISDFLEEVAPLKIKTHKKDTSFMHGKMYKRAYLEKHKLLAKDGSRNNEDVGFNLLVLLNLDSTTEKAKFIDFVSYYWLFNANSTVRKDKANYDRSTSFRGFAENLTYVFEELAKRGKDKAPNILLEKVTSMERLYLLYHERSDGYPQFRQGNLAVVKEFYHKIYKPIEHQITDEIFSAVYKNLPFKGDEKTNIKAIKKFIKSL